MNKTTKTASGIRVNTDSLAHMAALKAGRPAIVKCDKHPAFAIDNCPSCGTARQMGR